MSQGQSEENKMTDGLAAFADKVKEMHDAFGYWGDMKTLEDGDMPNVVAAIHRDVSKIYETVTEGGELREIVYIDPMTAGEAEPGKGVPSGLAVDVAEVIFDCMGLLRGLGLDVGKALGDIVSGQILAAKSNAEELGIEEPDGNEGEPEASGDEGAGSEEEEPSPG